MQRAQAFESVCRQAGEELYCGRAQLEKFDVFDQPVLVGFDEDV